MVSSLRRIFLTENHLISPNRKPMNQLVFIFVISLASISWCHAQIVIDDEGFETFEMKDGDEINIMKKYYVVLLKAGPNRTHDAERTSEIQAGHMAHIQDMAKSGKLTIAGPFADDSEYKGIFILNVPSLEEAEQLVARDPAVKAGRLTGDIHPWWSQKGSSLK